VSVAESTTCQGNSDFYEIPGELEEGDIATVWLVGHDSEGRPDPTIGSELFVANEFMICWGKTGADNFAIEASLIFLNTSTSDYQLVRGAYDPDERGGFDPTDSLVPSQCSDSDYQFAKHFVLDEWISAVAYVPYVLRIKPIYNSDAQPIAVFSSGSPFSPQGEGYIATATVGEGENKITRKVEQCNTFKAPPEIFDYVLYSESDLSH
jgi:hypothetical protein